MALACVQSIVDSVEVGLLRRPYCDSVLIKELNGADIVYRCSECVKIKPTQMFKNFRKANVKRHYKLVHKTLLDEDIVGCPTEVLTRYVRDKESAKSLLVRFHIDSHFPLCAWDRESHRQVLDPFLHTFGLHSSSHSIRNYMCDEYELFKSAIKQRLSKRMFACQFDLASRKGRAILGVSVQFVDQVTLSPEVLSIGMIPIHGSHTAINIKEEVEKSFAEFDLSPLQVIGYTTDNGGNVLKSTRDLLTEQGQILAVHFEDDEEDTEAMDIFRDYHPYNEGQIRCAAHTVQLAVNDFLKPFQRKLDDIREEVRKLRVELKKMGLPQPPLSNITRFVHFN